MTGFTYPDKQKYFPQLVYCGEKDFQLKFVDIQNNFENFLFNSWYLNINLFIGPTFIPEY